MRIEVLYFFLVIVKSTAFPHTHTNLRTLSFRYCTCPMTISFGTILDDAQEQLSISLLAFTMRFLLQQSYWQQCRLLCCLIPIGHGILIKLIN